MPKGFHAATGEEWMITKMFQVLASGKQAFDEVILAIGRMMAETFVLMDREEQSGPEYAPSDPSLQKWARGRLGLHRRPEGQGSSAAHEKYCHWRSGA